MLFVFSTGYIGSNACDCSRHPAVIVECPFEADSFEEQEWVNETADNYFKYMIETRYKMDRTVTLSMITANRLESPYDLD